MSEEKRIFIKKMENPIEAFPYKKSVKKLLSTKNKILRRIIRSVIAALIRVNYEYKCFKCDLQIKNISKNIIIGTLAIKECKKSSILKSVKCIKKIVEKNKIKYIILSKNLSKIQQLNKAFLNENLVQGKYLLKVMADEAIEYISNMKNERIENQTIYILSKDYSKVNLEIIENLSYKAKSVNIITNKLNKFLIFERNLYEKKGIMTSVSNNKRKSLNKAKWIVNLDFTNDIIDQYRINRNAIIINLKKEQLEISKSFSGIIVNGLNIKDNFNKEFELLKLYNIFNNTLLYESTIQENKSFAELKEKIKKDNIKIETLNGKRGIIQEAEYKNCLTNV